MHLPRISSVDSWQSGLCYARRPALSLTWVKEGNSRASVGAYVFWNRGVGQVGAGLRQARVRFVRPPSWREADCCRRAPVLA